MPITYVPTPDPLSRHPDIAHPWAWYFIGRHMGYLTAHAKMTRETRYASNRRTMRGLASSAYSTFLDIRHEADS